MRIRVEEIPSLWSCRRNLNGKEKLKAHLKPYAKNKGLNIKKAVKYLETNIIPISKQINSYIIADKKENKTEVTN